MKSLLMVAYHVPPCFGSSGILRTASFARHLPAHGWHPVVLTAHPRAYTRVAAGTTLPGVTVERAFALDAVRHLAVRGRTLDGLSLPDRWASWWLGAVPAGLRLVRRHRPAAIWSTFPIATAHLIGLTLAAWSGLPWVADFRDPMTEDGYPTDPRVWKVWRWIEAQAAARASALVFTTPSARDVYVKRYRATDPGRCLVVPNGFDEDDFTGLRPAEARPGAVRLVHAGTIYPEERDPRPFFRAIARLKRDGRISTNTLAIDLRAPGNDALYATMLQALDIADLVRVLPPLPYRESLQDCAGADALLLLQAASCNAQIPAKAYEYLRLGRPILALAAAGGDTAALMREAGGATLADLADEEGIVRALPRFLDAVRAGAHPRPARELVARYARPAQAGVLAGLLDATVARRPEPA